MRYRSMIRLARLVCLTLGLALAATCQSAQAQSNYYWDDPLGGIFNGAGYWRPDGGPPGSADTAYFNLSYPNDTYTVSFSSNVTNSYLHLVHGNVTFNLNNLTYTVSNTAYVADLTFQESHLTITNGTVSSGEGQIGQWGFSDGTVTVDGAGSAWSNSSGLFVGSHGTGTLNIQNGGTVSNSNGYLGYESSGSGTATVDGPGSTWSNALSLNVGFNGTGTLNILGGGAVSDSHGRIGSSSTGTVTVDGAGSTWNNSTSLVVGNWGTGTLNIQNGGTVATTLSVVVGGGWSGSSGTVTVDGAGSTFNSNSLSVGFKGTGTLTIQNGGTVSSYSGGVGSDVGSSGTVTVDGAGSTWSCTQLSVGPWGTGTLNILGGGTVANSLANVGGSGSGTVTVDGTGSTWSSTELNVSSLGAATLNILGGGTVTTSEGQVGNWPGSSGTVTVDGTGSAWTNSNDLYIGSSYWGPGGTGTLNIQNGGAVSSRRGYVGGNSGSSGTVTLTGADSTWTNTGSLYVGGTSTSTGGSGTVYVNNGATLTVGGTLKIWNTGSVQVNNGIILAGAIENAGSLAYDGTFSGDVLIPTGGMLTGSGTYLGKVTIAGGGTVSPGDSPGTMTWGSGLLEGGGKLLWEINHATGSPVTNWDLIAIEGMLEITATDLNPFLIDIQSLLPDNNPGLLGNFDNTQSYDWTFLTAAGGITGFSTDSFSPDESGFQNDLGGGSFSVSQVGNSLKLNFTPIPEPSTLFLCGIGTVALLAYSRRRRKRAGRRG